jgi:hypothetical protein
MGCFGILMEGVNIIWNYMKGLYMMMKALDLDTQNFG